MKPDFSRDTPRPWRLAPMPSAFSSCASAARALTAHINKHGRGRPKAQQGAHSIQSDAAAQFRLPYPLHPHQMLRQRSHDTICSHLLSRAALHTPTACVPAQLSWLHTCVLLLTPPSSYYVLTAAGSHGPGVHDSAATAAVQAKSVDAAASGPQQLCCNTRIAKQRTCCRPGRQDVGFWC